MWTFLLLKPFDTFNFGNTLFSKLMPIWKSNQKTFVQNSFLSNNLLPIVLKTQISLILVYLLICKNPEFLMEIVHARVCHGSHYKCTLHSEALFQLRLRPQFCRVHTWKNIRKEIGIKINHNLLELTYATFRWAFYGLFTGEKRLLKIMGFYDLFVTEIAFCLNKKKYEVIGRPDISSA